MTIIDYVQTVNPEGVVIGTRTWVVDHEGKIHTMFKIDSHTLVCLECQQLVLSSALQKLPLYINYWHAYATSRAKQHASNN